MPFAMDTDSDASPAPRKRQRSGSAAESSSSSKRALSAQPPDLDHDVPMEPPTTLTPSEKLSRIQSLKSSPLKEGETWFLVSRAWYGKWERAMKGEETKEGPAPLESEIGSVDNSGILDPASGELSKTAGGEAEYLPKEAWDLFVRWYGEPQQTHVLPRQVVLRGERKEPSLELYPPRIRLFKVTDDPFRTTPSGSTEFHLTVSSSQTLRTILPSMAQSTDPTAYSSQRQYRAWRVNPAGSPGAHTWPSGRIKHDLRKNALIQSVKLVEEDQMNESVEDGDAFALEFMTEGLNAKWIVDQSDIAESSSTPALTLPGQPMFGSGAGSGFFDRFGSSSNSSSTGAVASKTVSNFFKSSAAPKKPIVPGTLGLGNLGNTCFMNSALQCLAHTRELADYFLADVYRSELNADNPLGMGGAIANSFGSLLHKIWDASQTSTSYSPRDFKQVVGRFAPQFSGYQQHDTQELVAFLLDGLHEDLNRVLKKPYVEKPDWPAEGGGDKEMVKLAEESWEGYMRRNDSVIVDLFQNMYRSTLVCPECNKVSITFDPFMYLTLPLPVHKTWSHTVHYIPLDASKPHVKIPVEVPRDASFKDVRALLGRWMGAPPENLMTMEIFNNKFYRTLHDNILVSDMADNDVILCYELPCIALPMSPARTHQKNKARAARSKSRSTSKAGTRASTPAPTQQTAGSGLLAPPGSQERGRDQDAKSDDGADDEDEEDDEPFILSVLLAKATRSTSSYARPSHIGTPLIIAIPRAQATSVEDIERAVVDRLARWTSIPDELYSREEATTTYGVDGVDGSGVGGAEEEDEDADMEPVPVRIDIAPPPDAVTEITEDGAVRSIPPPPLSPPPEEEGDIADAKAMVLDVEDELPPYDSIDSTQPVDISLGDIRTNDEQEQVDVPVRRTGVKPHVFNLTLLSHVKDFGAGNMYAARSPEVSWSARESEGGVLLREDDQLIVELEENMVDFLFGSDTAQRYTSYSHPEFLAAQASRKEGGGKKIITLSDCLDEFTREEQLGSDDLWYCPGCKKHQQASKKFDLWGVPDVLVVHLKRFSSSRTLRDKIDELVEFPVEGLDLTGRVVEREVRRRLREQEGGGRGEEEGEEEPLLYDLFAVDEHLGGLGGGHYRAYALNHADGNWYHFDDSHVSLARAEDAVNPNAYLLFYRRRTSRPLGGKTHDKIAAAQSTSASSSSPSAADADADIEDADTTLDNTQLPTPPSRDTPPHTSLFLPRDRSFNEGASGSGSSSPPALQSASPPWSAADADLPSPSSVEAEMDRDDDFGDRSFDEPHASASLFEKNGALPELDVNGLFDREDEDVVQEYRYGPERVEVIERHVGEGGFVTPPPDSQDSLSGVGEGKGL
ncbi:UCH-domain-containing protein [Peniophora sp. CONT]|nr:UCH-domain-containing protein [Peniophora sp. CONT]